MKEKREVGISREVPGERISCQVCKYHCFLAEGQYGRCHGRMNRHGEIVCDNYGRLTAMMLDPIEKKPLRRFYPGSRILSVGSYGCNLSCPFCQNFEISMAGRQQVPYREVAPEELAEMAYRYREDRNIGVAFTYNEPLIGFEYLKDTAKLVHKLGMKNVVVTNGFAELWVLEEILPDVDAMNIDLKGFTDSYYRKMGGDLETVKRFIEKAAESCHVELTTLIVPGENDSEKEMVEEARWIASLDPGIPLHLTRFFPRYKMEGRAATEAETIYRLKGIAERELRSVYTGNL